MTANMCVEDIEQNRSQITVRLFCRDKFIWHISTTEIFDASGNEWQNIIIYMYVVYLCLGIIKIGIEQLKIDNQQRAQSKSHH